MSGSNTNTTTSLSSLTDVSQEKSSLSSDIEHISRLLAQDIPDDAADQDIATLLQQLERADSIGQNVEGRIDVILDKLDHLLGTLQHDGDSRSVHAQAANDTTAPQNDIGR
jgi:hypothetical protein